MATQHADVKRLRAPFDGFVVDGFNFTKTFPAAATGSSRTRTATTRAACQAASTRVRYTARRSRNDS